MVMADLLTVKEVAAHLRLDDYTEQKALLEELINAAKSAIEREMNRTLDTACAYTEFHTAIDINGSGCVYVDHPPIVATTAPVVYDDNRYSPRLISTANFITDADDGGFNYSQGKIQLWNDETHFASDELTVKVIYWGGWTTTTLPRELRLGWIELVQFWYENPERVGLTDVRDGSGVFGVTIEAAEIPQQLLMLFHRYYIQNARIGV